MCDWFFADRKACTALSHQRQEKQHGFTPQRTEQPHTQDQPRWETVWLIMCWDIFRSSLKIQALKSLSWIVIRHWKILGLRVSYDLSQRRTLGISHSFLFVWIKLIVLPHVFCICFVVGPPERRRFWSRSLQQTWMDTRFESEEEFKLVCKVRRYHTLLSRGHRSPATTPLKTNASCSFPCVCRWRCFWSCSVQSIWCWQREIWLFPNVGKTTSQCNRATGHIIGFCAVLFLTKALKARLQSVWSYCKCANTCYVILIHLGSAGQQLLV